MQNLRNMMTPSSWISGWWQCLQRCGDSCLVVYLVLIIQLTNSQNVTDVTDSYQGPVHVRMTSNSYVHLSFDEVTWYRLVTRHDWEVAAVVCRDLGQGHPLSASTPYYTTEHIDTVEVWCNGDESTLLDCDLNTNGTLYSLWSLMVECLPAQAAEFDVALLKRYTFFDGGIIMVYVDGQWGPVCWNGYPMDSLCDSLCKQLGYVRCEENGYFTTYGIEVTSPPVLGEIDCSIGSIKSWEDCHYKRLNNESCTYPQASFLEIECTNYKSSNSYSDDYGDEYPDDHSPVRPMGGGGQLFAVIVVLFVAFIAVMCIVCRKTQSETPATPQSQGPGRTQGTNQHEHQQADALLPSYDAVRNSTPPAPGYPPGPPVGSDPVYPPYIPEIAPLPAPEYQPFDPSLTNLAYPPLSMNQSAPNGISEPREGAHTTVNGGAETANEDPELPTYEEAIGLNVE